MKAEPVSVDATRETPPLAWRLLVPPVALTVLIVAVVVAVSLLQHSDLIAHAHAADPSASRQTLEIQVWARLAFGALLAVSWPLSLRRLSQGSIVVYRRCRQASALAAMLLLAVTLFADTPAWLRLAHAGLTGCELAIFAATMHPALRQWYTTSKHRRDSTRRASSR